MSMLRSTITSLRLGRALARPLSTSATLRFPSNPTGSPNAEADSAQISRDKQGTGKLDDGQHGGSAQGAPTSGGSGGPEEKAGMPDPEIPKGEAKNAKQGMLGGEGTEDSPARN